MELKTHYTEWSLFDALWSGGLENAKRLAGAFLWDRAFAMLEDMVEGADNYDLAMVNDLLWFDFDFVLEQLGYKETDDGSIVPLEDEDIE